MANLASVYVQGEGAILPDGRFIPDEQLRVLVGMVAKLCDWINELPPETRVILEAMAVVFPDGDPT